MTFFSRLRFEKRIHRESGYVALEFALAMGMLVLPTALILLQIPSFLEQHDRLKAISTTVAGECANRASNANNGQEIARDVAQVEMDASTSLINSRLISSECIYETGALDPGTEVTGRVSIEVPAAVIPGLPQEFTWTMTEQHTVIIPKYRSVDEQ